MIWQANGLGVIWFGVGRQFLLTKTWQSTFNKSLVLDKSSISTRFSVFFLPRGRKRTSGRGQGPERVCGSGFCKALTSVEIKNKNDTVILGKVTKFILQIIRMKCDFYSRKLEKKQLKLVLGRAKTWTWFWPRPRHGLRLFFLVPAAAGSTSEDTDVIYLKRCITPMSLLKPDM